MNILFWKNVRHKAGIFTFNSKYDRYNSSLDCRIKWDDKMSIEKILRFRLI